MEPESGLDEPESELPEDPGSDEPEPLSFLPDSAAAFALLPLRVP